MRLNFPAILNSRQILNSIFLQELLWQNGPRRHFSNMEAVGSIPGNTLDFFSALFLLGDKGKTRKIHVG